MQLDRLDHLVLTVRDLEMTCQFYQQVLGMELVTFEQGRMALHFGQQKINLHQAGQEFDPKALTPTPGSADLCFITTLPLTQILEHLHRYQARIIEGPVQRTGALGSIESIYIRDPDGNLIEIATYQ